MEPNKTIQMIQEVYIVKPESIKLPDMHLRMDVKKMDFRVSKISNVEFRPSKRTSSIPFTSASCRPELHTIEYCNSKLHALFQNFIGILR